MADLGAIEEDVPFDFGAASVLASACDAAASSVDGQAGSRAGFVSTGSTDFRGHFADLFSDNAATAAGDASELSERLREVAAGVRQLSDEAHKEQQRRETARTWKHDHDNRNIFEKGWDAISGGDDPPVGPPASPVAIEVAASTNRSRQTPAPGSGGGGSTTTSARPSNLRSFATSSKGANDDLRPKPGILRSDYSTFTATCQWGTLEASGVFAGFDKWLAANDQDVAWAIVVANAFAAAGGEGNVSSLSNSSIAAALKVAGVDATRVDLSIDPPQAYGHPPTTGYANDPVNTSTGNFLENETDLVFPGAAGLLGWSRCYNSFDTGTFDTGVDHGGSAAFGPGWSSLAEAGLVFDPADGVARFRLPDGRVLVFPRLGDGWDRAVGDTTRLTTGPDHTGPDDTDPDHSDPTGPDRDRSDRLRVVGLDGSWWSLAVDGTLDGFGTGPVSDLNWVRLVRDETGRLTGLTHARGRSLDLTWGEISGEVRIVGLAASDGRTISYSYDPEGRLTGATGPSGTRTYRWAEFAQQWLIAAVVDADGVFEAENSYDDQRRVVRQRSPFGRTTRFAYLPGRVTVVSDEDGSRSNSWIADHRGRLIGVVDANEHRQSTSYDRAGNPVMVTERDGATTVHEYDDRGRKIRTVTPSGADITWGYDEADRTTTVVTEAGAVTEYSYDGDARNPSTILDPTGGVTRLGWDAGLLTQVTDPTGIVVRYGYDDHGDVVATIDADGNTARLERDDLGRVTAAVTPSGHRTSYAYDPSSGLLGSRTNADGGTWRYEYTTGGRLTATIDPLGARTTIEHGAHGEESRSIDPLGRAVTRTMDDLGNLAAVTLPDGARWEFGHDALSRLTSTTDPTGQVWLREYDPAGTPTATIDPTGHRQGIAVDQASGRVSVDDGDATVTTGFDALGRATSLGRPDGSAALVSYDLSGRPVELLDADGALTLITRDAGGRPVEVTGPTGAVTRYAYDRCGRLTTVTDPLGADTTVGYDIDGQAIVQTLPTGEAVTSTFDVCGRVIAHHRPGAGTLHYTYDLAGRVVETTDPRNGRRTFTYDGAGQLVAVTDGNSGVTTYRYDGNGRAVEIVNPAGGTTRRVFDPMNRCVAETDPLGRTTTAGYDPAGRLVWQQNPDGRRLTWTYDNAGRPATMAVDGRTVTALTRDLRRRTLHIHDTTGDSPCEHQLEWNSRGQLLRRSRDQKSVTWTYDNAGRRTSMTTPDGSTTRYGWDLADRLEYVDHPLLGRASFDRDPSGRIVSATAGGTIQAWEHDPDGNITAHTVTDDNGATRTQIGRDQQGRINRITRDQTDGTVTTDYSYDTACQLVESRTRTRVTRPEPVEGRNDTPPGDSVATWTYDAAGRLIAETVNQATIRHVYDLAGQLLETVTADGRTTYAYDGAGRRTEMADSTGRRRSFTWNATGYLAGIADHTADQVRHTRTHADALGELAEVDGTPIFWDTAAYIGAPVLIGDTPILTAGPVTGINTDWTTPGWRSQRPTDSTDPWAVATQHSLPGDRLGGDMLGLTGSGDLTVGGLEWLGARVYDPASRGFLTTDPIDPTTGAGWSGNPYSYAGNDPLHALDPTGLHPVTDAELQAYRDNNGIGGTLHSAWNATKSWVKNNYEYIAGGAMVLAGGVLIATGVGGPVGMIAVGPSGVRWTTERLAIEGLRVDDVDDTHLVGVADPDDDEPRDFAVNLRTGVTVGGTRL